jgi:hypothetical protein
MYNGKLCASTTRYTISTGTTACGCKLVNDNTVAINEAWYGGISSSQLYCGSSCGVCYKLCATGYSPAGVGGTAGNCILTRVTDVCPSAGNAPWCNQASKTSGNGYGYSIHFDLANDNNQLAGLGATADNPEVTVEAVSCADWKTTLSCGTCNMTKSIQSTSTSTTNNSASTSTGGISPGGQAAIAIFVILFVAGIAGILYLKKYKPEVLSKIVPSGTKTATTTPKARI